VTADNVPVPVMRIRERSLTHTHTHTYGRSYSIGKLGFIKPFLSHLITRMIFGVIIKYYPADKMKKNQMGGDMWHVWERGEMITGFW